ncbi:MAG: ParA family protein [Candidatus Dormibacteria bacterium]
MNDTVSYTLSVDAALQPNVGPVGGWPIITIAAEKGGVGKSTIAYELAASLDAVLIDLDWTRGGVTGLWGYETGIYEYGDLAKALGACVPPSQSHLPMAPMMLGVAGRPSLVPMERGVAAIADVDSNRLRSMLSAWTKEWGRPIVIDTHPGLLPLSDAAIAAAVLTLVPMIYGFAEMLALKEFLRRRGATTNIILVPNRDRSLNSNWRLITIIDEEIEQFHIAISPPISDHLWLPRRQYRRSAVTLTSHAGVRISEAAAEFRAVAEFIAQHMEREGRCRA